MASFKHTTSVNQLDLIGEEASDLRMSRNINDNPDGNKDIEQIFPHGSQGLFSTQHGELE